MNRIEHNILYFNYEVPSAKGHKLEEISLSVIPDNLSHAYSANWTSNDFLGRISPVHTYVNGTNEVLSFDIVLHEDIVQGNNIINIVDRIKSLSYPVNNNGVLNLPRVYFRLGDISGFCIVQTNITWNKPVRDNKYIYTTISFTLTIDQETELMQDDTVVIKERRDYNVYTSEMFISPYTKNQLRKIETQISKYGQFTPDLINPLDSAELRRIKQGWAREKYNLANTRLNTLYSYFKSQSESLYDKVDFLQDIANKGYNLYRRLNSEDLGQSQTNKLINDYKKSLNNYKKTFTEYMKIYHREGPGRDANMTLKERDQVITEVNEIIDSLINQLEEVIGYGSSR